VSNPTETEVGLEGSALNFEARAEIFTPKGSQPSTDPLVVHVHNLEGGLELIDQSEPNMVKLFKALCEKSWPSPLTLVMKANLEVIPTVPTA